MRSTIGRKVLAVLLVLVTLGAGFGNVVSAARSTTPYPFTDDVENAASNNWVANGTWARTTTDFHSTTTSWTDSPAGYYANNLNISLELASPIDLTSAVKPQLKFWHHYQLEPGFDFGYVEISTDGTTWVATPLASYSGSVTVPFSGQRSAKSTQTITRTIAQEPWKMEQIDLTAYKGQNNVKIRFRLVTDDSQVQDGWSIDDIAIAELPPAVTLNAITNPTKTSLDLSWTQSADPNFGGYRVYRSLTSGVSSSSTLVTNIAPIATTTFSNTGLTAKTVYYYKVYTYNTYGIGNGSNEVSGATLGGLGYPFFDNLEAGGNNWLATPSNVWTLVTPDQAHSGNKVWTDSPQGNYGNNVNASLTLVDNVDVNPLSQLTFWQRLNVANGDNALVELSTDNGGTWNALATMTNQSISSWTRVQVPLGNVTGPAKIRFHLVTDAAGGADGWYIDDIGISNLPTAVNLNVPVVQQPPSKVLLTWSKNTEAFFKSYQVYRGTAAGVNTGSTLVTTITDQNTVTFMDSGLATNTAYYYKVYVVNSNDASNGSNEQTITTTVSAPGTVVAYPFFDDMESGAGAWNPSVPWGLADGVGRSGTHSWTDSPVGNYAANANTGLTLAVDLRTAQMPVLTFWQQYNLETNGDFGYIDVSTDGSNWDTIHFVTGNSSWREEKVDLTEYAVFDNVRIRFRLWANNAGTVADGWYIDDVRIAESATLTIPYPFFDDMENVTATQTNWLSSSFELRSPGHSGTYYWNNTPEGSTPHGTNAKLTLAGTLNLSGAVRPQLTFWHKYRISWYSNAYVQVSTSKGSGSSYTNLKHIGYYSEQGNWVQEQIDLTPYAGLSGVRLRFYFAASNDWNTWWAIDDVRIEEAPVDVTLNTPTNVSRHGADLSWTKNLDTNFARYQIHRDTSSNVTRASTLVATITDQATTTFSDTYSILEPSYYYYRVYVFNDKGAFSLGSNTFQAIYPAPPKNTYPFSDDMESGTAKWDWSSPWNLTDVVAHSATRSWTDSPVGNYANNTNTSIGLAVDLRTAQMPVLSFWHQYTLENNKDFGYIDVSKDGTNWDTIYFVTGGSTWKEEKIDLTEYAMLDNVRIRFRLWSDGDGTADGWYIDDVRIAETATTTIAYPFIDDMENTVTSDANWLSSAWELNSPGHSGTYYWSNNPKGATPSGTNSKLTMAGTLNLSNAVHPQLTFWQKYRISWYSNAYVQISTSKGLGDSYTNLRQIGHYSEQGNWVLEQIDLTPYAGLSAVRIRFLFTASNDWNTWWAIDDIRIEEAPVDVTLNPPANVTQHGVDLSWSRNADTNFVRYEVRRDTNANVTLASPLIASITNQATTAYTNIILETATYYYRVYVFNDKGAHSLGSNIVQAIYSPPAPKSYPFSDDMESGTGNWDWTAPWGLTEAAAHGGRFSWTDSPVGNYANSANSSLGLSVDMRTAQMPVLSFWHQYTIENNKDFGYIDVSKDGTNWNTIYFVTGSSTWKEEKIDLTEYAVFENVRIRFRLWSDGDGTADGWYIDDIKIAETTNTGISYPFFDDMETAAASEANWLSSAWELNAPGHSGTYYWGNNPKGATPSGTNAKLTLAGTLNLSTAVHPQLTFWHKYRVSWYSNAYVQVSTSKGLSDSYVNLKQIGHFSEQGNWVQEQIDLTPYAGLSGIRLRFYFQASNDWNTWWAIDDVRIGEAPTDVTLNAPTNVSRHGADISWSRNMDANFARYEIHRDTSSTVTLASTLVSTITDQAATAYTDTYSILEPNYYYYQIYVFNDKGTHSLGSNTVQAIYPPPPKKSYPFFDDMESGTANWDWSTPWGLSTTVARSGTRSWTDSPVGNYANNANNTLEMAIDLRTAQMPVLSFWQQYTLQTNSDIGYVDVSTDGINWNTVHFVTGNSAWREERVDLIEYAVYDDVRIRFRLQSDGSGTADGWYIDDVKIAETPTATIAYPFFDDMENIASSEANWLSSAWELKVPGHSGTYYWNNNPEGSTPTGTNAKLTLAGTINLSGAVNPRLTFWHKYRVSWYSNAYVQISTSKGLRDSYTNLKHIGYYSEQLNWVQEQIDLTPYVGLTDVRLRFYFAASNDWNTWWAIDDVRIDEIDTTPPAAINDLSAVNPTANTIQLRWTAPGDDDRTGRAWQYDIRYSTSAITAENFGTALQCSGEPAPQLPASLETFNVTGLSPFTTYYFAIKTADEVPNWSGLSNIASAATFQAGVVLVTVDAPRDVLVNKDFSAKIRLNNVTNFDACNYTLSFDPAVLQYVSVAAGDINGTPVPASANSTGAGTIDVLGNIPDAPGVNGSGYLAVVTFHVIGAQGTTSAITPSNGKLSDKDANEIPSSWAGDTVRVMTVLPGDANGDEKVDALDITKVERIVISLDPTTPGADANLDGNVNALDITKVERIILNLD